MAKCFCVIIGAGPAGLTAAIAAVRSGRSVVVLEKNAEPGRKLLLAGGGRANLIDQASPTLNIIEAYGRSGRFLRQALASFNLANFLKELGVQTEREKSGLRKGSIYVCGGAGQLLDALLSEAEKLGVEIILNSAVHTAAKLPTGGFEVQTAKRNWQCSQLIIATGGMTYPSTGSSGDGYGLAKIFGHEIEPPRPALGALLTDPSFPGVAGSSVADALVSLRRDGRTLAKKRGALLFTHHGVSGPATLDLSLDLARVSSSAQEVLDTELVADLWPDMTGEQLIKKFLDVSRANPKRRLDNAALGSALSMRLISQLVRHAGIDPAQQLAQTSRRQFTAFVENIKTLTLTISKPLDPCAAMVTLGGVLTKKIDPNTFQSRISPGLYFAGELLAPAGPCGGYNLLMAFATGYAAGNH